MILLITLLLIKIPNDP